MVLDCKKGPLCTMYCTLYTLKLLQILLLAAFTLSLSLIYNTFLGVREREQEREKNYRKKE